jgi:N-acetylmuramoyl-L-alanine amidase
VRTVVIEPARRGGSAGARPGALEKDVTLAIARKLRAALAPRTSILTRDRDEEIALSERAAVANNYKADLFVSIHANASRSLGAKGSEVYFLTYQATDDESRRMAALEGGSFTPGTPAPASGDLALILWDMAQAEHLEESSALASRIQEELAEVTGSQGRGVKQAPFRVLVGAAMPAVPVEVAFISNAEEERLLVPTPTRSRSWARSCEASRYQQAAPGRAGRRTPSVTSRTANALTVAGLVSLLALTTLTAPRWARLLTRPVGGADDEGSEGAAGGASSAAAHEEESPAEVQRQINVKLFFQAADRPGLVIEERAVTAPPELSAQLRGVVEELARGSKQGLGPTLAPETKVLDVFVGPRGVAYVDLSKEAVVSHPGGTDAELMTVYSLVNSLVVSFPAIKKVQILVEDRPAETLAGHVDDAAAAPGPVASRWRT